MVAGRDCWRPQTPVESWHGFTKGERIKDTLSLDAPGTVDGGDPYYIYMIRDDGVTGVGPNGEWAVQPKDAQRIPAEPEETPPKHHGFSEGQRVSFLTECPGAGARDKRRVEGMVVGSVGAYVNIHRDDGYSVRTDGNWAVRPDQLTRI